MKKFFILYQQKPFKLLYTEFGKIILGGGLLNPIKVQKVNLYRGLRAHQIPPQSAMATYYYTSQ